MNVFEHSAPLLVSIRDAQQMTSLGRTKIYELLGDNSLQSLKCGKRNRTLSQSIADWVERLASQKR